MYNFNAYLCLLAIYTIYVHEVLISLKTAKFCGRNSK
jgi:hypothetical protein